MKKSNKKMLAVGVYDELARMTQPELLKHLNTSSEGLDDTLVEEMQEKYGVNEMLHDHKDSTLIRLFKSFINPFTVVLLVLAGISFFTDFVLAKAGTKDITTVVIILVMVAISGLMRFIQEGKSGKEAEKLNEMVENTAAVQRLNQPLKEIPLDEIVVGDIIKLAAGDIIPADLRILTAKDLFISQSSLTGESEPVEKFPDLHEDSGNFLSHSNLVFMGASVLSGSATAVVVSVGSQTVFGSMAKTLVHQRPMTSFTKGLNDVSWVLIRFMMVMVPVVLFVNGFGKGNWVEAFLFALSIAVGLTPQMLPMLVTTNLAKGAIQLSKKKVIVKNLNAIQSFGSMDILCTDKTGTLTEDKIALKYYLDVEGKDSERVLRHAYLNSYFQTGLKNLMDIAILDDGNQKNYHELISKYHKIDEIPFDFNRRRMSVVIEDSQGKSQLITKGAVEEMLAISSHIEYEGKVVDLTKEMKDSVLATVNRLNNLGMRVIAVAQRNNIENIKNFSNQDESEMVLMGYLAFLDPPKATAASAIEALKNYGVKTKVLTGDNEGVTIAVCKQVGIDANKVLLGSDIEAMDDPALRNVVEEVNVFAKLSPQQKSRIVQTLKEMGHTVGYMGDGINDALSMKTADVGISVDTAVEIAKESADLILLQKDLMILEEGMIEGRKIFGNIIKYIKMTVSSNFGNMFSILVASAFIPFLPMLPVQILILNLIYDISCISIPWDNMDADFLKKPREWNAKALTRFMIWIGPISSIFDIATYLVMFFIICPMVAGGHFNDPNTNQALFIMVFHTGWFIESLVSQTLIIHLIRTEKIPFLQSRASALVTIITTLGILIGIGITYTPIAKGLEMVALPPIYYLALFIIITSYIILATIVKRLYIKKYHEWL